MTTQVLHTLPAHAHAHTLRRAYLACTGSKRAHANVSLKGVSVGTPLSSEHQHYLIDGGFQIHPLSIDHSPQGYIH